MQLKSTQLKEIEETINLAFKPIELIIQRLLYLQLGNVAEEVITRYEELKDFTVKLFAEVFADDDYKDFQLRDLKHYVGTEVFLRDHSLLPKLIFYPGMTLGKILAVYPHLPCPNYLNKNAQLKFVLGAWLPFLSDYSRIYPVKKRPSGKLILILNGVFAELFKERVSRVMKKNSRHELAIKIQ